MKARCCICGEEFTLLEKEFTQIEEAVEEFVCEKCAEICLADVPTWWRELQSHVNRLAGPRENRLAGHGERPGAG